MSVPLPRRIYPCSECPVRVDNATNPRSKFPAERWETLRATVDDGIGGSAPLGAPVFGCHKGEPGTDADLACAGWLAAFGDRSVTVRLAIAQGRLSAAALQPGPNWPPLHTSWEQMAEVQLWRPGDPADHLPCNLIEGNGNGPTGGVAVRRLVVDALATFIVVADYLLPGSIPGEPRACGRCSRTTTRLTIAQAAALGNQRLAVCARRGCDGTLCSVRELEAAR